MATGAAKVLNRIAPHGNAAAVPVTFAGTVGLFKPAATKTPASTAVLFVSPWGFEEMCTRKFWRILAEQLADAGIASLRFDYRGTGDALDAEDENDGLAAWRETALAASTKLADLSGCERVILISQGLGSTIAIDLANRLTAVDGIALLAPTISGRHYLRELSIWSKMIDDSMGVDETKRQTEGLSVAGLKMPQSAADELRKLNLMSLEKLAVSDCLLLTRPGRPADADFASRLSDIGVPLKQAVYEGYDELVSNPTIAVMPLATGARVVDWARTIAAKAAKSTAGKAIALPPKAAPLLGVGFRETPLRFGSGDRIYGILCEPEGKSSGATAILLTTAYDRSAGWGRSTVAMARDLARDGIPSLRFDTANVADSPPRPGMAEQVLYSPYQFDDVAAAFDLIEARRLLPGFVVGRCSGGYLAFKSAIQDPRCAGLVTVNLYDFYWNETDSVDEALRFVPRSLDTYGQKFLQLDTLKRIFNGQVDARSAVLNITTALLRRLTRLCGPVLDMLPFLSREHTAVMGGFRTLGERGVETSLIYSAEDIGLENFRNRFGGDSGLRNIPNARLRIVPDADHNLTSRQAQKAYLAEVRDMASRVAIKRCTTTRAQADQSVRKQHYAGCPAP